MDIINILAGNSYIIYNKEFAKEYGIEPAILLGAMCGYQKGFKNEYFYREQSKILDDTALTPYSLRSAIKVLQGLGVIEYEKRGMPAKYYYKVNSYNLLRVLGFDNSRVVENDNSRDNENSNSRVVENDNTYKNNNNNDNKNNNNMSAFDNSVAIIVLDYLNKTAGTRYKPVNSNLKFINARLKHYTVDDLKQVIDMKVAEWKGTKMQQYLRPETLFNETKFENYINGLRVIKEKNNYQRHVYSAEALQEKETPLDEF